MPVASVRFPVEGKKFGGEGEMSVEPMPGRPGGGGRERMV